jgi:DNA helicase-2/ATP-dependent DNA helicase PcrA
MTSTIEPHPDSPDGSVTRVPRYSADTFPPGSAVLCRNNAPLIGFAFDLIRRNVKPLMLGRDIAAGLTALVRKLDAQDMRTLRERLAAYEAKELTRLLSKGKHEGAASLSDRVTCIRIFMSQAASPSDVIANIDLLFSEKNGTVTLSSIHKAKGLEWETVFLLDAGLIPSRWATQPWELTQERNLLYVAVTRAKLHLKYINSDHWFDKA